MPKVTCPNGHRFKVGDADMGTIVECPTCKAEFEAVEAEEPKADDAKIAKPKGKMEFYGQPIPFWINNVLGKPLLFFGLILAVFGRGCDATGMRSVARANANYSQQRVLFELDWEAKMSPIDGKIQKKRKEASDLQQVMFKQKQEEAEANRKKMDEINKDLESLNKDRSKLEGDRTLARIDATDKWRPYREAALKAESGHSMWAYFNEIAFILGTLALIVGLLTIGFTGEGAERWIAYIMIAIVTFSIYVGGAAWIESIVTSAKSSTGGPPIPIERPGPGPGGKIDFP